MKPIILFLLTLLPFFGFAQTDTLLLLPQLGKEYIYEYTESEYILLNDDSRYRPYDKEKTIKIQYSNFEPGEKPFLRVSVEKNREVKPNNRPMAIRDFKYPTFWGGKGSQRNRQYYESLLCLVNPKYSINSETSRITLLDRVGLLLEVRKILRDKGFSEKDVDYFAEEFNEKGIPLITKLVQSIYRVPIPGKNETDPVAYLTVQQKKEEAELITCSANKPEAGLNSLTIEIDKDRNQLVQYNRIELNELRYNVALVRSKYQNLSNKETYLSLASVKEIGNNTFTISGKVEKVLGKRVILSTLQKPYGVSMSQKVYDLGEDNSFKIEEELEQPQLIFLRFGYNANLRDLPTLVIYAEPGNEVHLDAKGDAFPWDITFTGPLAKTGQMIYEYRKAHPVFDDDINSYSYLNRGTKYAEFEKASKAFPEICNKYRNDMPASVFRFIKKELQNQLYCGANQLLSQFNSFDVERVWRGDTKPDEIDAYYLIQYIDQFNINLDYNSFGIFSRQAAISYFTRNMEASSKVVPSNILWDVDYNEFISTYYFGDPRSRIELAKLTLAGPPLYSVAGDILIQEKRGQILESNGDDSEREEADEYLDDMLRYCNDKDFVREISGFVSNQGKWKDENYVPDVRLTMPDGKEVVMKDYFGEKPTIFYVSSDWAGERYYFDDLSKENPDINYVYIVEGSNLNVWKDFLSRAEPKAHQLLLMNDTIRLSDIFPSDWKNFILYNKEGEHIGNAKNPLEATNLMKQYLVQPKEKTINKSALITVIIVLVALLVLVVSVLLVWKWRVQQQFRKEQRERRLRELELTAIRSQMNPHFLFNSLNSVQNLVQKNMGREAHLYLSDFAGLIRKVLNNSEKEEVSLAEELEMTEQYLKLEKLRFDFDYSMEIDLEIDVHNTLVPSMLLQPFVENAIVHGLQNKTANRQLRISVKRKSSEIRIVIEDNGVGREAAKELSKTKNGKGTKLITERLQLLKEKQGEKYSIETIDLQQGTRVEIIIPEEN
ncbi:histidine kinase [Maribellus sp. YY47]|uniref:histidine kinase n=1 Tax=Maribellus sp. YY47 TaxID=2929486 RepID=UPI002001617B|nr:histidine kinase [Maribellus sp. YY47]MCK3683501.1 histidine kinase [Maribellus sp. YY47]